MAVFLGLCYVRHPVFLCPMLEAGYMYNIYIYIWINFITTSRRDRALGIMVFIEESSPNGRKIQVSEILSFTQNIYIYIYDIWNFPSMKEKKKHNNWLLPADIPSNL